MFVSARVSAISLFGDLPFGEEHYIRVISLLGNKFDATYDSTETKRGKDFCPKVYMSILTEWKKYGELQQVSTFERLFTADETVKSVHSPE